MILVDANILLYAEDQSSEHHAKSCKWWDAQLSGDSHVCLSWIVLLAYIRIATIRRIFEAPLSLEEAIKRVQSWLVQPCVRLINPTSKHWQILQNLLIRGRAVANLTSDAHLAALAIEHGCILYSTDADFSRFSPLKWKNPINP